jgi:hypothetical protein
MNQSKRGVEGAPRRSGVINVRFAGYRYSYADPGHEGMTRASFANAGLAFARGAAVTVALHALAFWHAPVPAGASGLLGARVATSSSSSDLSVASGTSDGSTADSAPALPTADAAFIAEAFHLVETVGDDAWCGFGKTHAPLLYITPDKEYAIGFPQLLEGFEMAPGTMIGGRSVQMGPRTHDPNLAASFPVHGVDAVVIGTPKALAWSPTQWTLKAAHETFHVFQHLHGWDDKVASLQIGPRDNADWQLSFPFPYDDPNIGRLFHLISYPTFLAIEASSPADAAYNAGVAAEALAVLKSTLEAKTGDEKAERYMLFQEATEGVAKYVERRIAEAAADGKYEPTVAFRALPGLMAYAKVWETDYAKQLFLVKHAGRVAKSRTEFYHLGLGKCLLLDRLDRTWKERYFDAGVWLPDLIESAIQRSEGPGK